MSLGFDRPLYILPFDHRGSFETGMFGWKGALTPEQTAQIAEAKQVIYDGFKAAVDQPLHCVTVSLSTCLRKLAPHKSYQASSSNWPNGSNNGEEICASESRLITADLV